MYGTVVNFLGIFLGHGRSLSKKESGTLTETVHLPNGAFSKIDRK